MKKSTIVLLIIAVSLLVGGMLLCLVGMMISAKGFDFEKGWIALGNKHMVTNEYTISDDFSRIDAVVTTADVEILPSTDDVTRVVCREDAREIHKVFVEDGTLKIRVEEKPWYQKINLFSWGERKLTVYLATTEYEGLSVKTNTGDVSVGSAISLASTDLCTDTGEIDFAATVAGKLSIKVDTGDISVTSQMLGSAEITATTGDVSISGITSGEIKIRTSTGEIEAKTVSCQSFGAKSSTGEHEYERLTVAGTLTLESSTGDISMENCDASEVKITTDTGDVEGHFLSPKVFYAKTDTGKVQVPKSTSGGLCEITTDTGNIKFSE